MLIPDYPFTIIDWSVAETDIHNGISGSAKWKTEFVGDIRVRLVEYSPGYKANHWCSKGHIIFCTEGEMDTELKDGRIYRLKKGMTYIVGEENEAHRSESTNGCKLFIVDHRDG